MSLLEGVFVKYLAVIAICIISSSAFAEKFVLSGVACTQGRLEKDMRSELSKDLRKLRYSLSIEGKKVRTVYIDKEDPCSDSSSEYILTGKSVTIGDTEKKGLEAKFVRNLPMKNRVPTNADYECMNQMEIEQKDIVVIKGFDEVRVYDPQQNMVSWYCEDGDAEGLLRFNYSKY